MIHVKINEIANNMPFTQTDIWEMAFYVTQTFDRYALMNAKGYAEAEAAFSEDDDSTVTIQFNPENKKHMKYAKQSLGNNLQLMFQFINLNQDEKVFVERKLVAPYNYAGGLNDFLYETLPQCLIAPTLIENGVMETYYDTDKIHRLIIHFFAKIKLIYSQLDGGDCPQMDLIGGHIHAMDIDFHRFSFREITLLSGYKTEQGVRNLASKSTPVHKRIAVVKTIKNGRKTFVELDEAKRWLALNKKAI